MNDVKWFGRREVFCFFVVFLSLTAHLFAQDPAETQTTPAQPATPPATMAKAAEPGNVSIDFKDADIGNVLRILSLKSGLNIVAGPEVQGTVTIRLENVPWDHALNVVLRTYGYVYEQEGNIIRVTTKDNLATEELVTETFVLNYTTAAEVQESIKDILSERGRVQSVARSNMLIVSDVPTNLHKIRQVIAKIDKSTPQAHIDSKIVKTQLQVGENLGIAWSPAATLSGGQRPTTFPFGANAKTGSRDILGNLFSNILPNVNTGSAAAPAAGVPNPNDPTGYPSGAADDPTVTGTGGNDYRFGTLSFTAFQATLNFLRTRANTKVISNPRITVLNNQQATIKVAKDVPYPTYERNETTGSFEISGYDFKSSGVEMKVTPHINDANEILVDLTPQVTSISNSDVTTFTTSTTASLQSLPNINVTTATTQILIRSGETIAIGGLLTDNIATTEAKVPVLGDIPGFGKLFRSKRQTQDSSNEKVETLFFVTVHIIDTEGEPVSRNIPAAPVVSSVNTPLPPKTSQAAGSGSVASLEKI